MATAAEAQKRAREYETIYVLRQDVDPDTADKVASRVAEVVGRENGKLVKVETWGRRKLAYLVAKQRRGVYYYLKYLGGGAVVTELERNLRMLDNVLKFQTVLLRDDVEVESVTVDPEEVKFLASSAARRREGRVAREGARPGRRPGASVRATARANSAKSRRGPRRWTTRRSEERRRRAAAAAGAAAPRRVCGSRPGAPAAEEQRGEVVMSQRNIDFGDDKDFGRTPDLNADAPGRRRGARKRVCKFCADKAVVIDYKDPQALKYFISDRGKVVPRRISGNCARHQRKVTLAIKRARTIALLPFTVTS